MVISLVIPCVISVGRMDTEPLAQGAFRSWNRKNQKYKDRSDNGSPASVKKFIDSFHNLLLTSEIRRVALLATKKIYSVFRSPLDIRRSDNNKNGKDKSIDRNMKSKIDKTMN
jgi:hypothetical protein